MDTNQTSLSVPLSSCHKFPVELWENIIELCIDHSYQQWEPLCWRVRADYVSLIACALTNKIWLSASLRSLYKVVCLTKESHFNLLLRSLRHNQSAACKKRSPNLWYSTGSFVQSIILDGKDLSLAETARLLAPKLPNLKRLHMREVAIDDKVLRPGFFKHLSMFRKVETLDLYDLDIQDLGKTLRIFHSFPSLSSLRLTATSDAAYVSDQTCQTGFVKRAISSVRLSTPYQPLDNTTLLTLKETLIEALYATERISLSGLSVTQINTWLKSAHQNIRYLKLIVPDQRELRSQCIDFSHNTNLRVLMIDIKARRAHTTPIDWLVDGLETIASPRIGAIIMKRPKAYNPGNENQGWRKLDHTILRLHRDHMLELFKVSHPRLNKTVYSNDIDLQVSDIAPGAGRVYGLRVEKFAKHAEFKRLCEHYRHDSCLY